MGFTLEILADFSGYTDIARGLSYLLGFDTSENFRNPYLSLTPTEYDLLRVLAQHGGKVLTHRQILRLVWGEGYETDSHLLRVNISNLRRKIEKDPTQPRLVLTEAGIGYRLAVS